ncbi:MAG: methylamine utilization protein [Pseudomonadales bacterium]
MCHPLLKTCALAFALLGCCAVNGIEILVTDQHGNPVPDAVVELAIAPAPSQGPSTASAIMDQVGRQFAPRVLAIHKGRNVELPNSDNVRHHVYSFSPAKTFELKLYKGVAGKPLSFDTVGLVTLGCNIHDRMIGYIYVSEFQHVAVSDEKGRIKFDVYSPPATASVWHPDQENAQNLLVLPLIVEPGSDATSIVLTLREQ